MNPIAHAARIFAAASLLLVAAPQTALANRYSADVAINVPPLAGDETVLSGAGPIIEFPGVPGTADLVAYHLLADGNHLFALDTTVLLPGDVLASPGDVIHYDGADYSRFWVAADNGLPRGAITDAITLVLGELVLSFDTTVILDTLTVDDDDLVSVTTETPILFFDSSLAGIDPALDLDAASYIAVENGPDVLFVSFDGSGQIAGINFDDEDVLAIDTAFNWSPAFGGHTVNGGADVDAFHAVKKISFSGFESTNN